MASLRLGGMSLGGRVSSMFSRITGRGNLYQHTPYIPHDAKLKIQARAGVRDLALRRTRYMQLAGAGVTLGCMQQALGVRKFGFYAQSFKVNESVDGADLADFYGTEDFMEMFSVFPFVVEFLMRGGNFDDDGHVHTYGIGGPGQMEVAMEFTETEDEDSGDLTGFNKYETFEDVLEIPILGIKYTIWKMATNFGFRTLKDGSKEIYHEGTEFSGPFFISFVFILHSYYVIWATERHINSSVFKNEEAAEWDEAQRKNMPLQVLKDLGIVSMGELEFKDWQFQGWKEAEGMEEEEEE